ncbi:hypothetical protein Pmani_024672 [Petrolisthes manimaculis]|uniref:Luciferin 4-monooxygenase n=1 Tax=Petrolisthes manimaculis TaxID=1843537 RepID=A0AAE1TZ37_9EUCA|nr:hypothetical protein Pmani_024672 [Petrolisthes manimaculis]
MASRLAPVIRCLTLNQCRRSSPTLSQIKVGSKKYSTTVREENVLVSPFTDVEIPDLPFANYVFDSQEKYGGHTALVDGMTGVSYTHDEVRSLCMKLGSALTRLDITQGDRVAIVLPNCPEFAFTFMGGVSIGACVTTINCTYTAEEIAHQLANSGASAVVTNKVLLPKIKDASKIYKSIRHIIVSGHAEENLISMENLLKDDGKAFPQNVQINPAKDVAVLPYSSGTTGLPKGVMLTHRNLVANLQQVQHPGISCAIPTSDTYQEVYLGILPFFHIYGMIPCLAYSLCSGGRIVTLPTFDPKVFISSMKKYKVTFLHTVPPIINFMTHNEHVQRDLLSLTHHVTCGAAPVGATLIFEFFKKFGDEISFQEGFGMTESSPVTHLTPKNNLVAGSTGLLIPNTEAKIVDINTGQSMGPDEGEGELCVRGPQVMKGYYRNEDATKNTIDKDGWLHTGDIARMDENENIFIVDRLKELIKVKGLQVAPAELEDLIRKHPDVADVAVIGLPDVRAGEVPRAYVVPVPGSSITDQAIAEFVEREVAPHKKLTGGVHFTDCIPKSATGKILRRELKAAALA